LDEVQKSPQIFDTIKSCYDQNADVRFILLGSSQVMLMKGVRESLAGRAALVRMYAMTLPELMDQGHETTPSALMKILEQPSNLPSIIESLLDPVLNLSIKEAVARQWSDYILRWGAMPALLQGDFTDQDRLDWLRDYQELYLQRDLGDLARLSDLEPFTRTQKIAALRSGSLIQYSSLGAAAGVSANTAKRYMQYLELSYQIILLQPWFRNVEKRLNKSPKLHFLDNGVRRGILRRTGDPDGLEWESTWIAECIKQAHLINPGLEFYHLRTTEGREVDLLMELHEGYMAFEFKLSENIVETDARHLRGLSNILDKPLLAGFVVSQDPVVRPLQAGSAGESIWAIPAWRLFA